MKKTSMIVLVFAIATVFVIEIASAQLIDWSRRKKYEGDSTTPAATISPLISP